MVPTTQGSLKCGHILMKNGTGCPYQETKERGESLSFFMYNGFKMLYNNTTLTNAVEDIMKKIEHAIEMTQNIKNIDNAFDENWIQQTRSWYEFFYTREEAEKRIAEFNADTTQSHIINSAKYYKEIRSKDISYRVNGSDKVYTVRLKNFEGPDLNNKGHHAWVTHVVAQDFYDEHYLVDLDDETLDIGWPVTFTILNDEGEDVVKRVECDMVPKFYILGE